MNRKEFIESLGATGKNWTWSWSFINEKDKVVIFGAWTHLYDEDLGWMILSDDWKMSAKGRWNPGYTQALEHLRLVESEKYKLFTFPMVKAPPKPGAPKNAPAKIQEIIQELSAGTLVRDGSEWYSSKSTMPVSILPDEIINPGNYFEGARREISVNVYERNARARTICVRHYGRKCIACKFDFENQYGKLGAEYIHVHHLKPLSEIQKRYKLDPIEDLRPVCPNCHAMIHRRQPALTIKELQKILSAQRDSA